MPVLSWRVLKSSMFIALSIVARGARFYVVAILMNRYGVWIRETIEKHLGLVVTLALVGLIGGFVVAFKLF